ncbi:MAG: ATP-binding protein [Cellulosilyticum sp.]|nr:ATP-binding protein [Cellulosilyticum sp.]
MPSLKFSEVFKPGTYPEHTYVERTSKDSMFSYEQRLNMALGLDGFLVCITGPSKTGKTVLCEKVIGLDNIVSLNGNDFEKSGDFWGAIALKAGIPLSGTQGTTNTVNLPAESIMQSATQNYVVNKDAVVKYFVDNEKVLVLDDFHYASDDMQYEAACQLKDVIRRNFKAVVISLPHRSDDPLRQNPDLNGRIQFIELQPWTDEELIQIPQKGFQKLNVVASPEILSQMTLESAASPQLMQYICFNLSLAANQKSINTVTHELLQLSCRITTVNLDCKAIVDYIKFGPPSRGQKRVKYQLTNGKSVDIYELLLYIIAENPPYTKLPLEEIKKRSDALIVGISEAPHIRKESSLSKPNSTKLKDALGKTQERLKQEKAFYNVIECKDNALYVLESLFLFYLRWSNWKERD